MKTLTLNVPDSFELDDKEVVMFLAAKLYEQGKLSLSQASDLAGMTKRVFAETLANYNVSIFNSPISDLEKDVQNA